MSLIRVSRGIFISYRREETAANAGRLYDRLSGRFGEYRVFMDIDSIAIGTDFANAIADAVSSSYILLVLIGRNWLAVTDSRDRRRIDDPNDWVRIEIETALQRDIPAVPVLVDGATLPQADELPPPLRPFLRRQAFELSHTSFRSDVEHLITLIDELIKAASSLPEDWNLELTDYSRASLVSRHTFHLSLGSEVHEIIIEMRALKEVVKVDGQQEVVTYSSSPKTYPLRALSSALGSDVTISWVSDSPNVFRVALLDVKIGNQFLRYERILCDL
jgi:hypothetical protein